MDSTHSWRAGGFLLLLCAASLAAVPARGVNIVGATSANFTWTAAPGPVAGYALFVNRNSAGYLAAPDQLVTAPGAVVSGSYGDTVVIKVAAYDSNNTLGPFSPDSALYQFVAAAPATLTLSATTVTGTAVQGQSPATTSFSIQSPSGALSYALSSGAAWLSVSPAGGTASPTSSVITVSMNPTGLGPGTYTSTITATARSGASSPATIGVIFTVSPPPAPPVAPPVLALSATTLSATAFQGQNPATKSFLIQNTGGGTLSYSLSSGAAWLSVSPASGTSTGNANTIAVALNPTGLGTGTYTSTITATAAGATGAPATIGVVFTVNPAPSPSPRHGHRSK